MINFILVSSTITISLYLLIVLISFDLSDPSWLQTTWNGSVHNLGGIIGARFADFLFFIFGISAYIIPVFILLNLWRIYTQAVRITIFLILFKLIELLVFLFVCCGLINSIFDDFCYFPSGGIIGCILYDWIFSCENLIYYVSLVLFFIGMISITLFFNQLFVTIIKIIKNQLVNSINMYRILFYRKKKSRYQDIHCRLYNQERIYPAVILVKKNHCLQDTTHKFLEKEGFSNVLLDINNFSKKFNFNFNNHHIAKTYINFSNILKSGHSYVKNRLRYPDVYLNNINQDNYKKNYTRKNVLLGKSSFNLVNKYKQRMYKNSKLHVTKDRQCKNNILLKKNSDLVRIVDSDCIAQRSVSVANNIQQQCSSALKKLPTMIDPRDLRYNTKNIIFPDINLLMKSNIENSVNILELQNTSQLLEKKLAEYRIVTNVVNVVSGPIITRFELNLSPGIKSSKIVNLSRDLARSLSVTSVRVVEIIPGTPYVGLEIPNRKRSMVCLRDIISSDQFRKISTPLALVLGQDISGNPIIEDLRCMPHLLVAGATGSGKSVGINTMIISILYKAKPDEVRFIMIDPKILELSIYSSIPHILKQVITDVQSVDETLQWCIQEMERRYQLMAVLGVRNLENYNCYIEQLFSGKCVTDDFLNKFNNSKIMHFNKELIKLPYIVIIIDEFSDLVITGSKKIEELIIRLTQKARAAGIHLILATQRPSVNVITGLIKANIPARVAFTVSSKIDSHTIIGQSGAESLLGRGDMLYLASNAAAPIRVHGAFIRDQEVHAVVNFWKNQTNNS